VIDCHDREVLAFCGAPVATRSRSLPWPTPIRVTKSSTRRFDGTEPRAEDNQSSAPGLPLVAKEPTRSYFSVRDPLPSSLNSPEGKLGA
jgi:hypothetical protein